MEVTENKSHFYIFPTVLYISSLVAGLLIWWLFWLKPGYCSFPSGKYKFETLLHSAIYKPKSLADFCAKFGHIFKQLDPEYWIPICGTETYYYLYSQRKIISLTLYILGIYFGVKLVAQMFEDQTWNISHPTLKNVDFNSNTVRAQHMIMITTFTIVFIIVIVKMIKHFSQVTLEYYANVDKLDLKYLQLRTLHVRGMFPEDLNAQLLKNRIKNCLEETGGKMVALKIIPNYSELVKYETKRRDLILYYTLLSHNMPTLKRLWLPKKFYNKQAFDVALQKLDKKIQEITEKKFSSSGHAFVCFDSVTTMYRALKVLDLKPNKILKHTLDSISVRVDRLTDPSNKNNNVEQELLKTDNPNSELIATPATEPVDIVWRNMGGIRGIYFYRRILINIIILTILFFASTPAGILKILDRYVANIENYQWAYNISPDFGKLVETGFPPLAILAIGGIILILINISTGYEKHIYRSDHQKSIFIKAVFYQTFNMVFIPGFGIIEKSSVFSATKQFLNNPHNVMRNFYGHDTAAFFVTIIMQTTICFYLLYFLRLEPVATSYLSPWLLYYRQEYINRAEKWSKKPSQVFTYGYLSAQILIVFFIVLIFSTTIPLVVIVGMLYFCVRHVVDSISLLVIHRMELNSRGSLTRLMLSSLVMCCLLFQICYAGLLLDVKAYVSFWILLLNIGAVLGLYLYVRRPFFDLIDIEKRAEKYTAIAPEYINRWQDACRHPLVLRYEEGKQLSLKSQVEIILHPDQKGEIEEPNPEKVENMNVQSPLSLPRPSHGINLELSDSKISKLSSIGPNY